MNVSMEQISGIGDIIQGYSGDAVWLARNAAERCHGPDLKTETWHRYTGYEPLNETARVAQARAVLIAYLETKVQQADWHAVSDAANDLRVLEAQSK
jgi:hypothetical protein